MLHCPRDKISVSFGYFPHFLSHETKIETMGYALFFLCWWDGAYCIAPTWKKLLVSPLLYTESFQVNWFWNLLMDTTMQLMCKFEKDRNYFWWCYANTWKWSFLDLSYLTTGGWNFQARHRFFPSKLILEFVNGYYNAAHALNWIRLKHYLWFQCMKMTILSWSFWRSVALEAWIY